MRSSLVVLLTGAGSGIGRAAAIELAARGCRLTLVGRVRSKLETTLAACPERTDALLLDGDLAEERFATSCIDRSVERFGRLDVLVNCAGIAPRHPIASTTTSVLESAFRTNTYGPAILIARAWPIFAQQSGGLVVNVSTIGTSDPFPGFFAYAASKSALDSFTRSINREGADFGIRAVTLHPGAVETPLLRSLFSHADIPSDQAAAPESVAAEIVASVMSAAPRDAAR